MSHGLAGHQDPPNTVPQPADSSWLSSLPCQIADLLSRIDGIGSADGKPGLFFSAGGSCGATCLCEMPLATDMGDVHWRSARLCLWLS